MLSTGTSWKSCLKSRTWKYLFLSCKKSMQSVSMCFTVMCRLQTIQNGCSSRFNIYEWVNLVCRMRSRVITTSSLLTFRIAEELFPTTGFIPWSLLKVAVSHDFCHSDKMYLLIRVLKLLKGISNVDMFNWSESFAFLSAISLLIMPTWLGSQQRSISLVWAILWCFSKSFWICEFFEDVWLRAFNTERESENNRKIGIERNC